MHYSEEGKTKGDSFLWRLSFDMILDCLFPLSNSLAASCPSWRGEILSSLLVFSLLCWCMAGTVCVIWHDARYLKCRPGSFCASELERFDCFTRLNICTYTWCQHTGLHTLTHRHTPGYMCTAIYEHTHTHCRLCLEEPLYVTVWCNYFPIDLLCDISYSDYAT